MKKSYAIFTACMLASGANAAGTVQKCNFSNGVPAESGYIIQFSISTSGVVSNVIPPAAPNGGTIMATTNATNPFYRQAITTGSCPSTVPTTALDGTGMAIAPIGRALKPINFTNITQLCLGANTANTAFSVEFCEQ